MQGAKRFPWSADEGAVFAEALLTRIAAAAQTLVHRLPFGPRIQLLGGWGPLRISRPWMKIGVSDLCGVDMDHFKPPASPVQWLFGQAVKAPAA